jgi:hypothetical protein
MGPGHEHDQPSIDHAKAIKLGGTRQQAAIRYIESMTRTALGSDMKHLITTLSLVAAGLSVTACGHMTHERYAGPVVAVPDTEISPCTFLDDLSSSSGLTGFFAPKGVDNIKQNLLRQADKLGATHVVWGDSKAGYDSTSLTAKAYRCTSTPR